MYTILGSDQKEYGPVDEATVVEWIQSGRANAQTMIQKQGAPDWQPISRFPEFAGVLGGGAAPMGTAAEPHHAQPEAGGTKVPKVFGILNIVFGSICGLCTGAGMVMFFGVMALIKSLGGDMGWVGPATLVLGGLGFIFNIILVVSGIGLLKRRNWGRTLSNVYAVVAILQAIGSLVLNLVFLPEAMADMPGAENNPAQAIGNICGGIIALIYPILLLIFLNKQEVKSVLH
jgi:hypothetical protein